MVKRCDVHGLQGKAGFIPSGSSWSLQSRLIPDCTIPRLPSFAHLLTASPVSNCLRSWAPGRSSWPPSQNGLRIMVSNHESILAATGRVNQRHNLSREDFSQWPVELNVSWVRQSVFERTLAITPRGGSSH